MATISLCMIVKNEEAVLERCLQSIADIVDEIVIVDTGSTDKTKQIARKFTDRIYDFEWIDDFSAARNFSFSKASMDYVMWLDADDVIDDTNRQKLLALKDNLNDKIDVVMMQYHIAFDKENNPTFSYSRERVVKRSLNLKWVGEIHEVICTVGNVLHSDIAVLHKKLIKNDPKRNLKIFQKMIKDGKKLDARQKFYYARELQFTGNYKKAITIFKEFLKEENSFIENKIETYKNLAFCYKMLSNKELQIQSLINSFTIDCPRAEICCEIGDYFFEENNYKSAIFWYTTATQMLPDNKNGGFCLIDCYGYIPFLQLCVCYEKIGNMQKAYEYNEKAGKIKPKDDIYLYNKKYFEQIGFKI